MVTKTNTSHDSLHFSVHDIEVEDARVEEMEAALQRHPRLYGRHDAETLAMLDEIAAGAIKRIRFADKRQVRGLYISLARAAAERGMKLQRIPDPDDPLVSYIRKRPDGGRNQPRS